MRAYAQEELDEARSPRGTAEEELKVLLLPKDPNDEKDVILEIRAGTAETRRLYLPPNCSACTPATRRRRAGGGSAFDSSESSIGGIKEVIAMIRAREFIRKLKYESGVHRVQRVPATEQQGRIHTSAVDRRGAAGSGRCGHQD